MRLLLFHLPLLGMLSILGFFALIDAGPLGRLRTESTFAWMVVVWYPLSALLALTQVILWIRWVSKRGIPSAVRSRQARRIACAGFLVLAASALLVFLFRMAPRWGFLD